MLNIALVVADTLRQDAFEQIEAKKHSFEKQGFSFYRHCIASSPWTLPSHASMFTGMYPSEHGAHESKSVKTLDIDRIKLKMPTIVTELKRKGYATYAISANPFVTPVYGFNEFDEFFEESYFTDVFGNVVEVSNKLKPLISKYRNLYGTSALKIALHVLKEDPNLFLEAASTAALLTPKSALIKAKAKLIDGWPIEKGGHNIISKAKKMRLKEPFFLFVNLMEAHDPYVGKKSLDFDWATPFLKSKPSEDTVALWRRLYKKASSRAYAYAAEISRFASSFGEQNTLEIFTSDHGQMLGEHNFFGHGTVLYDQVIRIPLAVKMPDKFENVESGGYQSLTHLRKFISTAILGKRYAARQLSSREVRSESFGIPANISVVSGISKSLVAKYDVAKTRRFSSG
ncbi:MAG: sulfatase-like hydrolase/transferase [Candidatus Micrarchaeaceae archaeon]